jgi:hypothetical protein
MKYQECLNGIPPSCNQVPACLRICSRVDGRIVSTTALFHCPVWWVFRWHPNVGRFATGVLQRIERRSTAVLRVHSIERYVEEESLKRRASGEAL